ncbi:MAG: HPF/RaiA family ribosome-associated protein [Alphaproteobacteria bacterium]|nr:HPF/RaiA family ribosome-associated protein [Alphaproteobacteria bacterium]
MQLPLQVTFRDIDPSEAVEARIRERAERLDRFHERIMGCRVRVAAPRRQGRKGHIYQIRIELTVPGDTLIINRAHPVSQSHEDVYVAIRDAFDAAERQLDAQSKRQQGEIKTHATPPHGRVSRLFRDQNYGFITDSEGTEIYFHANSVTNDGFPRLEFGSEVRYTAAERESEKGPQASTVHVLAKNHHIVG